MSGGPAPRMHLIGHAPFLEVRFGALLVLAFPLSLCAMQLLDRLLLLKTSDGW